MQLKWWADDVRCDAAWTHSCSKAAALQSPDAYDDDEDAGCSAVAATRCLKSARNLRKVQLDSTKLQLI